MGEVSVNFTSTPPAITQTQVRGATTVNIQNVAFNPASVTVHKGTTLPWVNQDSANHEVINDARESIAEGGDFGRFQEEKERDYLRSAFWSFQ